MKASKVMSIGLLTTILLQSFGPVMADEERRPKNYPKIYPFVPVSTQHIHDRLKILSEDPGYIRNAYSIEKFGLGSGKTASQPWTSTYWPLNKGLIADPYTKSISLNPFTAIREVSWQANNQRLKKRRQEVHAKWAKLDQDELDELAPSEKYDLLLGDDTFHLTNKLRQYMFRWGSKKDNGDLSALHVVGGESLNYAEELNQKFPKEFPTLEAAIKTAVERRGGLADQYALTWWSQGKYSSFENALPEAIDKAIKDAGNYVLRKKTVLMALWEGICHGWSTAAGHVPRPRRSVSFNLGRGKTLKFFPDDIKALASLMWAHNLIQDIVNLDETKDIPGQIPEAVKNAQAGVYMQGLRCNDKSPGTDEWGRLYDDKADAFSKKLEARCVGVHPAIWHLALANIIGKQKRSFVVERKVSYEVDNHPMSSYKFEYFNPYNGDYSSMQRSVRPITTKDQFYKFRNPEAKFIVGVKATIKYLDWARPQRESWDHEKNDELSKKEMLYDLEMDATGKIVGGQWRATEHGKPTFLFDPANHNQPDFFWVVTKYWKPFFKEVEGLTPWTNTSELPPADWKLAAFNGHNNLYNWTHAFGWNLKCEIENEKTDKVVEVACERKEMKPKPLINVINKLIELAK